MGLSRSTRIYILLSIDVCFFFAELITGYAVGSLALVADSFHMLNDVMSLIVALYAIKLTGKNASTTYSYGWHRAEILAALINATFLLALCFSIFMEAIERFVNVPEVSNPKLVVILGCFGLSSNIVGLFLFHDHGHSHGHGDHDHKPSTKPQKIPSPYQDSEVEPLLLDSSSQIGASIGNGTGRRARSRSPSVSSLFGHPVQTRAAVVATAQSLAYSPPPTISPLTHRRSSSSALGRPGRSLSTHNSVHIAPGDMDDITEVNSAAATPHARGRSISPHGRTNGHMRDHDHDHDQGDESFKHAHAIEAGNSQRRHSHGSMNMRALVLHVMGDALGNVGVIGSGLIIWLTTWQYRYYSDPIISLIITCIIFSSALPLVKSASFILLQGVPESVNLEDVREDISAVDGVVSIHELHVWQLSESKHVASVHILLRKKDDFMRVVRDIRRVLHEHDIHNGTIQPEFGNFGLAESEHGSPSVNCLVTCPPGICQDQTCCPNPLPLSGPGGSPPS